MQIPWWAKIGAKLVLSRLPFGYTIWRRLGVFRHGKMDESEYAVRTFFEHLEKAGLKHRLDGKSVLELGPGDSIASAIIAAAYGGHAIIVDSGRYVCEEISPYLELENTLILKGMMPAGLSDCSNIDEILDHCKATYLTEGLDSLKQIESGSVDFIFSQAVLEHIRKGQFLETMQEMRRILKKNGVCSHRVDEKMILPSGR